MFTTCLAWLVLTIPLLFAQQPRRVKQSAAKPPATAKTKTSDSPVPIDPDAMKKPVAYPSIEINERIRFWIGRPIVLLNHKYAFSMPYSNQPRVRIFDASEDFKDVPRIEEWKLRTLYRDNAASEADYARRSGKIVAVRNLSVSDYPQRLNSENWVELLIEVDSAPQKLVTWIDRGSKQVFGFAEEMELAKTFVGKHFWNRDNSFYDSQGRHIMSLNTPGKKLTVTAVEWKKESTDPMIKVRVRGDDGAEAYISNSLAGTCFDNRFHLDCHKCGA